MIDRADAADLEGHLRPIGYRGLDTRQKLGQIFRADEALCTFQCPFVEYDH